MDPTKPILGYVYLIQISTQIITIRAHKGLVGPYVLHQPLANIQGCLLKRKFPTHS